MEKALEKLDNIQIKHDNKVKGYEPKCKVCNNPKLDEIHRLHSLGCSNRDVMRELELEGVFSEQALGRHFKNHYPKTKEYEDKKQLMDEKAIQKAIKKYPPFKRLLFDNDKFLYEKFLNDRGYCCLTNKLCYLVPETFVLYPFQVTYLFKKSYDRVNENDIKKKLLLLTLINRCYECQLRHNEKQNNLMFEILIAKLFNKDVDFGKDIIPKMIDSDFGKDELMKFLDKKDD